MIRDSQNTERTVEQYVRGIVNMDLSDEVIANILSAVSYTHLTLPTT